MHRAGFEPAHPEIVGLKSTALDHSANDARPTYGCRSHSRSLANARTFTFLTPQVMSDLLELNQ